MSEPQMHARSRKSSTGETAADAAKMMNGSGAAQTIGMMTLALIREAPATGEEVFAKLTARGVQTVLYSVKPRLSELARKGYLVDSGVRRVSHSGRAKSIVWREATPAETAAILAKQEDADNG